MAYIDEQRRGLTFEQITGMPPVSTEKDFMREFATLHHMELAGAAQRPGNQKVFVRMERKD